MDNKYLPEPPLLSIKPLSRQEEMPSRHVVTEGAKTPSFFFNISSCQTAKLK
jgi:hypothetical protein